MAVKLRLRREGTKKQPHFRVVAADSRSPRDGRFIEIIGEYHPLDEPSTIKIDEERALHWLRNGAQPTGQVKQLLRIIGVWETFKPGDKPQRDRTAEAVARAEKRREQAAEEAPEAAATEQATTPSEPATAEPEDKAPEPAEEPSSTADEPTSDSDDEPRAAEGSGDVTDAADDSTDSDDTDAEEEE